MKAAYFLICAAGFAGCAGQPANAPPPETHRVKVDATNVVAVQRAGYKLVNKDGQPLYCRTDMITGSHIQTRTVCLTEQELDGQINATKQAMAPITSKQVGPSGH